jgi:hypothetical protein
MADVSELVYKPITDKTYRRLIKQFIPHCNFKTGAWVAGGSVRKVWFDLPWESQDIDLFFANQDQFDQLKTHLSKIPITDNTAIFDLDLNFQSIAPLKSTNLAEYETNNAVTYTVYTDKEFDHKPFKIQAIKRYFVNNINELFQSFDFTVTQFATDGKIMVTTRQALKDCEEKRLQMIEGTARSINALRTIKYTAYGFEPVDALMEQVITALSNGEEVMIADDY